MSNPVSNTRITPHPWDLKFIPEFCKEDQSALKSFHRWLEQKEKK